MRNFSEKQFTRIGWADFLVIPPVILLAGWKVVDIAVWCYHHIHLEIM